MTDLLTPQLVVLDADLGRTSDEVVRALVELVVASGRASDAAGLHADAMAREAQSATGLPGGLAIPHCRSEHVSVPTLAVARLAPGADFGAKDGAADLVFLLAAPAGGGSEHLKLLSALARSLVKPDFPAALRAAADADAVVALVSAAVAPPAAAAAAAPAPAATAPPAQRTVVAVTACPTGIAHTYMAADALIAAGERAGVRVVVETQGSSGSTPLEPAVIAGAAAVVFATDVGVKNRERFAGKPVVASGVKRAINEPDAMVAEAVRAADDPAAARVSGTAAAAAETGSVDLPWGVRLRQILLTGVSYMIPFVAAGGLLIALGFLLGGYQITDVADAVVLENSLANLPDGGLSTYLGAVLFKLGALAFSFLVPALAGYIAYAIADRPGLAPGFTVGAIAGFVGAGFLGGLVGGLLAGFAALWISRLRVP
ncbi:MAG: PTS lactose transporter subunit IIC, partial [Frankiales bacterium]